MGWFSVQRISHLVLLNGERRTLHFGGVGNALIEGLLNKRERGQDPAFTTDVARAGVLPMRPQCALRAQHHCSSTGRTEGLGALC